MKIKIAAKKEKKKMEMRDGKPTKRITRDGARQDSEVHLKMEFMLHA